MKIRILLQYVYSNHLLKLGWYIEFKCVVKSVHTCWTLCFHSIKHCRDLRSSLIRSSTKSWRTNMESQTASKRNRFACRSPIDRSCKRVKLCETPTTDSDASFSSDDDSPLQTPHLFEALPADLLGTILFSGYVDSLEIIHKTSCISKEAMELARSQVKMLDLRMCVKLHSSNLSFLIERFPMLEVSKQSHGIQDASTS